MAYQAFRRESLAQAYCDSLEGKGIANSTSGLFLAGPRRVGKSTFLKEDLILEGKSRNWLVAYVDLWANSEEDPGLLISETIKATLKAYKSKVKKLQDRVQLNKIKLLGSLELDFSQSDLLKDATLYHMLDHLHQLSKQKILLVIDEAQHALSSDMGLNVMFALKSARDQMNLSYTSPNLMLVFTGSNRNKLTQLVIRKDQPFFGCFVTAFPLLGRDFSDFYTDKINNALAKSNQFNKDSMWEAFQLTGHKPEVLRHIVSNIALNNEAISFSQLLESGANDWQHQIWGEFKSMFETLNQLQQLLIKELISNERRWSPFSDETLQLLREATNNPKLSISTIQKTLTSLKEKNYIWQSSRGVYALEDEGFAEWFKRTQLVETA